ncbi:MAG: hypothetical protein KDK05_05845 [Candidatus Competibacteraceae bacterium]|nr:hypothetical protein [Candidatus Competibacteraceae bacterium]
MSALHSTPIISPGTQGQHRQHCPDTDPDHKKGKCISIDADRRVWKCHRCNVGGSLDQLHQLSESERQRLQDKRSLTAKREAAERQQAASRLRRAWDKFSETGTSEYLTRKGFANIKGLRYGRDTYGQFAAMPLYGPGGDFRGFQRFYGSGKKMLAAGTHKQGAYFLIPGSKPDIVVCEGLTTGASVALATGYTVAIAVDCGNVGPTVASLKAVDNNRRIILGADNDQWADRNAGLIHAYAAAHQHQAEIAVPDFTGLDTSGKPTDFNDLHQLAGLNEVARQIEQASTPAAVFCQQTVKAIQQKKPRLVALRASHGTGKTQHIIKPIVADSQRAAVIGHRIALMRDTANRLALDNYQDIKSADFAADVDKLALCIHSLIKPCLQTAPALQAPDVVVIDEFEQVKAGLAIDPNMKTTAPAIYDRLMQLLASAEQIILSDADLNAETVAFFEVLLNCDATWYTYEPPKPNIKITVIDYDAGITQLQDALATGRALVGSDSKKAIGQLQAAIPDNKRALLVSDDTKGTSAVKDFFADPAAGITQLDCLLYSPSIGSGVSFETPHFDKHFLIYSGVVSATDALQMAMRDRTATDITVLIRNVKTDDSLETEPEKIIVSMELRKRADRGRGFQFNISDFDTMTALHIAQRNAVMRNPKASLLALCKQRGFTVAIDDKAPKNKAAVKLLTTIHAAKKEQAIQDAAPLDPVTAAEIETGKRAKTPELAAQLERYRITEAFRLEPDAPIEKDIFERWDDGRGLATLKRADNAFGSESAVEARSQSELKYTVSKQKNPTLQRRVFRRLLHYLNIDINTGCGEFTYQDALTAWREFNQWRDVAEGISVPRKEPKYPARWASEQLAKLGLKTTRRKKRADGKQLRVYSVERKSWDFVQEIVQRRETKNASTRFFTSGAHGV